MFRRKWIIKQRNDMKDEVRIEINTSSSYNTSIEEKSRAVNSLAGVYSLFLSCVL